MTVNDFFNYFTKLMNIKIDRENVNQQDFARLKILITKLFQ